MIRIDFKWFLSDFQLISEILVVIIWQYVIRHFLSLIFYIKIYYYAQKCPKNCQLSIIKTKKELKKACERYQDLSEEDKNKKHHYGCKQYKNLSEYEKQ